MIVKLDHRDQKIAELMLDVQLPAYKVEAKLINFEGIPQLKDTVESIQASNENFIGYFIEKNLVAFLSYTDSETEYQICRLVVHPTYFKQGIARRLVNDFLKNIVQNKKVIVSTGSDNSPAINLYLSSGFTFQKKVEVAPNVFISLFEATTLNH